MLARLTQRFAECGLTLHPQKTRLVYCKDDDGRGEYPETSFDFLGYTFRARRSKNRWGKYFVNFSPGMSAKAGKRIRQEIRGWKLPARSDKTLADLARMFDQRIRGWVNYYGAFYKSALYPTLRHLDRKLVLWATRKYKRLRGQAHDRSLAAEILHATWAGLAGGNPPASPASCLNRRMRTRTYGGVRGLRGQRLTLLDGGCGSTGVAGRAGGLVAIHAKAR